MFDFLSMAYDYKDRKVDRFEGENFTIDTCAVTDSDQPFETGIVHPKYNNNEWVIVEMYNSKKEAQEGHRKWVKKMTENILPDELFDVSTSTIKKLLIALD